MSTEVGERSGWRPSPRVVYFSSVVLLIVIVNTGLPDLVLGGLFGAQAGNALAASLQGITRDLFVLLLVSLYFEFARGQSVDRRVDEALMRLDEIDSSIKILGSARIEESARRSLPAERILELGYEQALGRAYGLAELARITPSGLVPVEGLSTSIRVEGVEGRNVKLEAVNSFRFDSDDVVVLFCEKTSVYSALSAQIPNVLQTWVSPSIKVCQAPELELFEPRFRAWTRVGSSNYEKVSFKLVDEEAINEVVPLPAGVSRADVVAYRAVLEPSPSGREFRTELQFEQDLAGGYCFWSAERPTFLARVDIDLGLLTGYAATTFHVSLPQMSDTALVQGKSRISLEPSCWVLPGHAVFGMWQLYSGDVDT